MLGGGPFGFRSADLNFAVSVRLGAKMLTKFEMKSSNRVKGLSFHSKRPWILASLHSGVIELWDYQMRTLIDQFDEHDGPVRGVHFHESQPLFVSGGDDCKVKVWNYKLHRCLFNLLGHLDYIRTVQFHHEYPWIVSASDDHTIRIWNWQSRNCISVLTGHNHYVMCASFHLTEDLVVSASLDQTVRVWDTAALRMKSLSPSGDVFGGVDAVVKHVLEGHDRGVNWAAFHSTLPLIVSGADDRQVKLWRMNDTKAWEADTLRGHTNNVSCVMFYPKQDGIVSISEDKSIRVWDVTKRTGIKTFNREHDRFWILAAHPKINLLAAGHDSGMIVFKLERERPAYSVSGDSLIYTMDRFLHSFEYSRKRTQLTPLRRPGSSTSLNQSPRTLSCSPTGNAVLLFSDADGGSYELYIISKDSMFSADTVLQEVKRGAGGSAIFVSRNKFAVLDKSSNQVLVKNLNNEVVKKSTLPIATDAIFYAGTGNVLCRAEDRVVIFDLQQRLVLGELAAPFVKYVVWSNDKECVALLSKHAVIIANKRLVHQCTLHETIRVKSGAWDDDNGVFIYSTLNHIKYSLPNGDTGIIKTIDAPMYITKVSKNTVFCLDRDGTNKAVIINTTEYMFKLSLFRKRHDHTMNIIRNSHLYGQAMIAYLKQKGFPELALHFVKDERTRFNLALESGNMRIAVASAEEMDDKDQWYRLGIEALRQGNAGIVEYAYQRTKNFERLSFLYLITGNLDKLSKMLRIAESKNDVMSQFHNALYLGDVQERAKILENAGHIPLAYVTAKVHGLEAMAERLSADLGDNVPSLPAGKLLMPPPPILCCGDWPLLTVAKGTFEGHPIEEDEVDCVEESEPVDLPPVFVAPTPGMPAGQARVQRSLLAAEHAAVGNFRIAMALLYRQLGIENFAPLKSRFIDLHAASQFYLSSPSLEVATVATSRLVFSLAQLQQKLKAGYKATTNGNFTEALKLFLDILHTIPLIVVESRNHVAEVKKLIIIAKDYVLGIKIELERRKMIKNNDHYDSVRVQELAAYFTHCNLQAPHMIAALRSAMQLCYKAKNYATASGFARRLLEMNPGESEAAKVARSVLEDAEKGDAARLEYELLGNDEFVVCGASYVQIYRGEKDVCCPYCSARFVGSEEGEICGVCDLGAVGDVASGLRCLSSSSQVR
ncbi:Coatomer subunit alpha-1 [Linum perenne]